MNFKICKLYAIKLKNLKTKKIGWLQMDTNRKIKLVYKKDATWLRDDQTYNEVKKIIESNGEYKIVQTVKETVLSPN